MRINKYNLRVGNLKLVELLMFDNHGFYDQSASGVTT